LIADDVYGKECRSGREAEKVEAKVNGKGINVKKLTKGTSNLYTHRLKPFMPNSNKTSANSQKTTKNK
jgi:hypothetical protein